MIRDLRIGEWKNWRNWGKGNLNRVWFFFLCFALLAGLVIRMVHVHDMEYKEDEEYNFTQSQAIGTTQPWPWVGIPSGVYLINPGMSIWVFAALAKVLRLQQPTSLAHGVQLFAVLGMVLILPFARRLVPASERKTWYWAFALAMVNPFLVWYHRKLWPEGFLPFFTLLTLMGWWVRDRRWGAFIWGFIGAWLGQIHMSGFFFGFALFLWTVLFAPNRDADGVRKVGPNSTRWGSWFIGSTLGALPLIPWLIYVIQHPLPYSMTAGWREAVQLKYWSFWLTDPIGLHLGNTLGLHRGPSNFDQISDFARYPLFLNHPTYLVGAAHVAILICAILIFGFGIRGVWKRRHEGWDLIIGRSSNTAFIQNATLWGCGLALTLTGVVIRRYYMAVTFPLEFLFLVRLAQTSERWAPRLLTTIWISQLIISANFVGYIHVNQGSTAGDYGTAYHLIHPNQP